eukprot:Skav204339  [mRNA]  locus=scaffold55:210233:214476:+ [translate_table: standard]
MLRTSYSKEACGMEGAASAQVTGRCGGVSRPRRGRRGATVLHVAASTGHRSEMPITFPMYTVPVRDVLEMETMRPHEALMRDDVLVEFHHSMGKAAFVSHQWVSPENPDPELAQFKTLQGVLRKILTSSAKRVDPLIMTELMHPFGWVKGIRVAEFRSRPLFIWYDFFSCPQVDSMKWSIATLNKPIDQALASIPAYIARLEKALKELQPEKKYIEDHVKLGNILARFLQRIVLHYLREEHFTAYRFYLNLQSVYLRGFPAPHMDLFHPVPRSPDAQGDLESSESLAAEFLFQHGFKKVNDIDSAGWPPLCYAALRGDANLVKSVLEEMADPDARTWKHQSLFGVQKGMTAWGIAIYFGHNAALNLLIEARADLSKGLSHPIHLAAMANNVDTQLRDSEI